MRDVMNLDQIRSYLNTKQYVSEELPFGPQALVFKVMGKMYALIAWEEDPLYISLKCDPDRANSLRASYSSIKPAYHMNKKHWNMIYLDGVLNEDQLKEMIDHSYDLVVNGLRKADQIKIKGK
jgi:predicted DNA-binding protein (MmcQ/YjbR family)